MNTPLPGQESPLIDYPSAAEYHARRARELAKDADEVAATASAFDGGAPPLRRFAEAEYMAAQTHALVAIAMSQLSPPARRGNHPPRVRNGELVRGVRAAS